MMHQLVFVRQQRAPGSVAAPKFLPGLMAASPLPAGSVAPGCRQRLRRNWRTGTSSCGAGPVSTRETATAALASPSLCGEQAGRAVAHGPRLTGVLSRPWLGPSLTLGEARWAGSGPFGVWIIVSLIICVSWFVQGQETLESSFLNFIWLPPLKARPRVREGLGLGVRRPGSSPPPLCDCREIVPSPDLSFLRS